MNFAAECIEEQFILSEVTKIQKDSESQILSDISFLSPNLKCECIALSNYRNQKSKVGPLFRGEQWRRELQDTDNPSRE